MLTAGNTDIWARWLRTAAMFVAVLAAVPCVASETALVRFRPEVVVSGSVVRMADVADIHAADQEWVDRVGAVTLHPAPAAGRSFKLDYESIRSRLIAQGINLSHVEFTGKSVITITSATEIAGDKLPAVNVTDALQQKMQESVAKAVARTFTERVPDLGSLSVLVDLNNEQAALLSSAGAAARLEIFGGKAPWTGTQMVSVRFLDRMGRQREVQVTCQVTPRPRVIVLRRNLPKGQIIQAEDVAWKQLDADDDAAGALDRVEAVVGQETKTALRAGEPIDAKDIRGIPLIRRGDIVTVISRSYGITVRMEAKAEGDGAFGQQIALTSLDRKQKMTARVAGYHEAEIIPAAGGDRAGESGIRFLPPGR